MFGNYGDFDSLPRISVYGEYMATEYYLPSKRIYTVTVYSIKDDVSLRHESYMKQVRGEYMSPIYEKIIGGR
jgi:hypothetical protein